MRTKWVYLLSFSLQLCPETISSALTNQHQQQYILKMIMLLRMLQGIRDNGNENTVTKSILNMERNEKALQIWKSKTLLLQGKKLYSFFTFGSMLILRFDQ